jgi:hypothetical protein
VVVVVMRLAISWPKSCPRVVSVCHGVVVVVPKTRTKIRPNNHKVTTRQVPSRRMQQLVPVVTKGSRNSNTPEEEEDAIRIAVVAAVADEAVEMAAVVAAVAIAFEDEAVEMAIEMVVVAEVADGVAAAAPKEAAKEAAVGLLNPRLTKHTWKSINN